MKAAVLLMLSLLLLVPAVHADGIAVGYVDMRKILTQSKTGLRIKAELDKLVAQRKQALAKEEEKLKALQATYEKDKLLLSESQKQEKQKDFQQKLQAYQKSAATAQREIAQKESEYAKKAIPEIRDIIRQLAKEEKLTFVFEKNEPPALYAIDGPDLTDKVLARYDKTQK